MQFKTMPSGAPLSTNEAQGRAVFVANSTNVVDRQGDNLLPNAWAPVLGSRPKILVGHEHTNLPVGKVLNLRELMPGSYELPQWHQQNNAGALIAEAQFDMNRESGRDAFSAIKGGYSDSFSVGFLSVPADERYVKGTKQISRVTELAEISVVLMAASPGTQVLATKGFGDYARESADLDLEDIIEGIAQEAMTDAVFHQAHVDAIVEKANENPELVYAAMTAMVQKARPGSPQAIQARRFLQTIRSNAAASQRQAATTQRVSDIRTIFSRTTPQPTILNK